LSDASKYAGYGNGYGYDGSDNQTLGRRDGKIIAEINKSFSLTSQPKNEFRLTCIFIIKILKAIEKFTNFVFDREY
jgi:hypothetical protein